MMFCNAVLADSPTVLSVDNVSGSRGSQVDVKVNITANSGMAGGSFILEYDPAKVAPVSYTVGSVLSGTYNFGKLDFTSNSLKVNWAGVNPINTAGEVVTIKFNILSGASTGITPLILKSVTMFDKDTNDISFTTTNGSINIGGGTTSTTLSVDNISGSPGSQVDVKVSITANSGMAGGSFILEYDPAKVAPVSYTVGSVLSGTYNFGKLDFTSNSLKVNWAGVNPINTGGELVTIKFNILSGVSTGITPLTLKSVTIFDKDTNDISFTTTNGSINIGVVAQPEVYISPAASNSNPGGQFAVIVKLKNASNIKGIDLRLNYNSSVLTVNSIQEGLIKDIIADKSFSTPGVVTFAASNSTSGNFTDSNMLTINFSVKSNAASGATALTLQSAQIIDGSNALVTSTITNGTVNVTSGLAISSSNPASNAVNVPVNKTITVSFNANIQAGTTYDAIVLKDPSNNIVTTVKTINGSNLTIKPSVKLEFNKQYTLVIPTNAVKDMNGTGLTSGTSISFTSQHDITTLPIMSVLPAETSGAIGKDITVDIMLKYALNIKAADLIINYDSSILSVKSVYAGQIKDVVADMTYSKPGEISFGASNRAAADFNSVDTSLLTVVFTIKAAGKSNITLSNCQLLDGSNAYVQEIVTQDGIITGLQGGTVTGKIALEGRSDFTGINITVLGKSLSAITDKNGMFSLQGVPEGAQTLVISKDHYLIKKLNVTITNGSTTDISTITLKAGDASNDNKVDLVDLGILASSYRARVGESKYDANADFNNDGIVDLVDLGFLASNYRISGD